MWPCRPEISNENDAKGLVRSPYNNGNVRRYPAFGERAQYGVGVTGFSLPTRVCGIDHFYTFCSVQAAKRDEARCAGYGRVDRICVSFVIANSSRLGRYVETP